ncbi:unnamed protein product [Brassica napus]|uniref:(rape) hypothetical protein n=1 Tax=Brassica napus TaxID=3708 RepID=A0A816VFW0_BRANA|nr:unnamed protein product [Brassica napus]
MAVIRPKVINVGLVTSLCVGSNSKPSRDHFSVWWFLEATSLALSLIPYTGTAIHSDVDSVSLDENTLKQDLEAEIHEENYVEAAKIRDILKELQEYNKASVLSANTRFYQAFRNGDLADMESLWCKSGKPCCVDELRVPVTD